jgi:glutaminyl-peptide cyclotransferase
MPTKLVLQLSPLLSSLSVSLRCLLLFFLLAGALPSVSLAAEAPVFQAEVVNTFPHDSNAFTQGLIAIDGQLYEGTGRKGQSSLRLVELESGEMLKRRNLSNRYFGEGITLLNDKIYQLTWRSQLGFIYERESFELLKSFFLPGEGWGITHDGSLLIVSDGTSYLRFIDPDSQQEVRRIQVTDANGPVDRLNELEYINGEVWANVWYASYLIRIDPVTGMVNSRVDLAGLTQNRSSEDVLNGIAWDEQAQRLFVTGKLWPNVFEIRVLE